jgi:hypothetical protein
MKTALCGLLLVPAVHHDWQQYDDKGMSWRIVVFPLVGLVVPVAWRLLGRPAPYPYLADGLLVAVPLTDVLWNTLDVYDRVWWWDDLNHLLNSVVIAYVIGLLFRLSGHLGPVVTFFLCLGVGMTLAVGWELAEYPAFLNNSPELVTAYQDTLGDLALALIGSAFGAFLVARQPSEEVAADSAPEAALA